MHKALPLLLVVAGCGRGPHQDEPRDSTPGDPSVERGHGSSLSRADLVLEGAYQGSHLGIGLGAARDLDGDGYGELLLGTEAVSTSDGEARVSALPADASGVLDTPSWSLELPWECCSWTRAMNLVVGDFDGDGIETIAVGYSGTEHGDGSVGFVSVDASGAVLHDGAWAGGDADDFGHAMVVGDLDLDGHDDLVVGSPGADLVELFPGSPDGLADSPSWSVSGQEEAEAGHALALGDFDCDGLPDLAVGEPRYISEGGVALEGALHLFRGSAVGLETTASWSYAPARRDARLGASLAVGDFDGDGCDDLAAGAETWHTPVWGGEYQGAVTVFYGSAEGLSAEPEWTTLGTDRSYLGCSLSAGDVDGDGLDDLLIGAERESSVVSDGGGAFLFSGSAGGLGASPVWSIYGESSDEQLGRSVLITDDLDRDGFAELVVASKGRRSEGGQIHLFDGPLADADGDGYGPGLDCDDHDGAVYAGADEWCDGVDNDCDGHVDEPGAEDAVACYPDLDGDGYGTPIKSEEHCSCPPSWSTRADDCDDRDASVHPAAPEVPSDGVDNDCDGVEDRDDDGDGWSVLEGDCNDANAAVHPGAVEVYDDRVDNDCDGHVERDSDGDGFSWRAGDCDDGDPSVGPGMAETWYDGGDSDCAGDDDFDADADGWSSDAYGGWDCDDGDPGTLPWHCVSDSLLIDGTTLTTSGTLQHEAVWLIDGGAIVVTPYDEETDLGGRLVIEAEVVYLSDDSRIDAVGAGYVGGQEAQGHGPGGGRYERGDFGSGGGYGRDGGASCDYFSTELWGGSTYGASDQAVIRMGSGGGSGSWGAGNEPAGTAGGGVVELRAGTVVLHGAIDVSGQDGTDGGAGADRVGGSGSGGGILILADDLDCTGSLVADGGDAEDFGWDSGPGYGAGGRIKVFYGDGDPPACSMEAGPGAGPCSGYGSLGHGTTHVGREP